MEQPTIFGVPPAGNLFNQINYWVDVALPFIPVEGDVEAVRVQLAVTTSILITTHGNNVTLLKFLDEFPAEILTGINRIHDNLQRAFSHYESGEFYTPEETEVLEKLFKLLENPPKFDSEDFAWLHEHSSLII